jgi:hypothetical protein
LIVHIKFNLFVKFQRIKRFKVDSRLEFQVILGS